MIIGFFVFLFSSLAGKRHPCLALLGILKPASKARGAVIKKGGASAPPRGIRFWRGVYSVPDNLPCQSITAGAALFCLANGSHVNCPLIIRGTSYLKDPHQSFSAPFHRDFGRIHFGFLDISVKSTRNTRRQYIIGG